MTRSGTAATVRAFLYSGFFSKSEEFSSVEASSVRMVRSISICLGEKCSGQSCCQHRGLLRELTLVSLLELGFRGKIGHVADFRAGMWFAELYSR